MPQPISSTRAPSGTTKRPQRPRSSGSSRRCSALQWSRSVASASKAGARRLRAAVASAARPAAPGDGGGGRVRFRASVGGPAMIALTVDSSQCPGACASSCPASPWSSSSRSRCCPRSSARGGSSSATRRSRTGRGGASPSASLDAGRVPFVNAAASGGEPLLANPNAVLLYPTFLLERVAAARRPRSTCTTCCTCSGPSSARAPWRAGCGLARRSRRSWPGVAFAFSGMMLSYGSAFMNSSAAAAWLPWCAAAALDLARARGAARRRCGPAPPWASRSGCSSWPASPRSRC